MNKTLKISIFSFALLSLFAVGSTALADSVTGNLSTGLSATNGSTVNGVVIAPPVASPIAGSYSSTQSVALTAGGASSINYTTDGITAPTCSTGIVYSGVISVSSTMTIEAISCYSGGQSSSVASYAYTITPITSSAIVSGGGGGGGGGGGAISPVITTPITTTTAPTAGTGAGQVLGATAYNFTKNLTVGSTGADVTALQQFLKDEGFYSGPITGYFGQLTKAAVIAFQKANGIVPATGYVGPLTRALLNKGEVPTTTESSSGSGLTAAQISAIISILQSFGVDQATLANVEAALGQ